MRLSPIEIRQHRFNYRFRGLDAHEVHAFLETLVGDFDQLVREHNRLRAEPGTVDRSAHIAQLRRVLAALRRHREELLVLRAHADRQSASAETAQSVDRQPGEQAGDAGRALTCTPDSDRS